MHAEKVRTIAVIVAMMLLSTLAVYGVVILKRLSAPIKDVAATAVEVKMIVTELKPKTMTMADDVKVIADHAKKSLSRIEKLQILAGATPNKQDDSVLDFAIRVMQHIEDGLAEEGMRIGVKKITSPEITDVRPLDDWMAGTRGEAVRLIGTFNSKRQFLKAIGNKLFRPIGDNRWMIQFPSDPEQPVYLLDWLAETDPECAELLTQEDPDAV